MNWIFDSGDVDIDPQKVGLSALTKNQQNLVHGFVDELDSVVMR
jgi:hypothetical protein